MKKLFVSVPMRGRTEENIRKSIERMHEIAEAIFNQELELIDSYVGYVPEPITDANKMGVYCLGQSIKMMAYADYFIGVDDTWMFRGCAIEREVAHNYDIPKFYIGQEYVMDDYRECQENLFGPSVCEKSEARCE